MKSNYLNKRIAAGIVLYNPDNKDRLLECIDSVSEQFEKLYIFDNSTKKVEIEYPERVSYITENLNKGIAYALNRIMEVADKEGYDWVVTLDQDSILPKGLLNAYEESIENDNNIAIVCPQVIDLRRTYESIKKEPAHEYVEKCITSASCTSINAWKRVGKFDEWLFIDLVDNEFCKRLRTAGYKILKLNNYVLNQEFGKIITKSEKRQAFWIKLSKKLNNVNIAKFSYKKFVSPMRVYYTHRNIIYVNKKMKNYGVIGYESFNCKSFIGFLISFSLPSFFRAQNKIKVLYAILKGIYDGKTENVKPWIYIDE